MEKTSTAIGIWLICGGMFAFCLSYLFVVKKQQYLLGNLTMMWFRCLTWIVVGGLSLLTLDSLNRLLFVALFWRR